MTEPMITCASHPEAQVRLLDCEPDEDMPCITANVSVRGLQLDATVSGVMIYADLPDFLDSLADGHTGEWRSPHADFLLTARPQDDLVRLSWTIVLEDGHFGSWQAAVETWADVHQVRQFAGQIRALLPRREAVGGGAENAG